MIQAVRGTKDILPDIVNQWQFIEDVFRISSNKYSYKELRTPIFESTEVFSRGIGDGTDVVNKEMYTFKDKGDNSITLRPEMTAALVRSVIQNSLIQQAGILRLWYFGPFFRYERPQKGRQRQFHQYGAECLGSPYPESDVEIILLANDIIRSAGIPDYNLLLNSLGNDDSRKAYRNTLTEYLKSHESQLSEDSKTRLEINPLRILDSKDEADKAIIGNAPIIYDSLDSESKDHFEAVKSNLEMLGINYTYQPRLVRGLDYYCHTVFEFQNSALGAQDLFGGGGRYNGLFSQLGGKDTPAVGFAMGVERILLILEQNNKLPVDNVRPDFYIVTTNTEFVAKAFEISEKLRTKGFEVQCDIQRKSLKAQFRDANKFNARYTMVLGEDEIKNDKVSVKKMETGEQFECSLTNNFTELENL